MTAPEEGLTGFRDSELERAWDLLIGQYDDHCNQAIYILNARAEASMGSEESDRYRCASLMVLNAGISILNIKKFYRPVGMHTKDVVVLYRVVFESLLNALYVLAAEPDVARRALNHAIQKKYRAHGVTTRLGPFRAHVQTNPLPENIRRLINDFTSRKGKELNWSDRTIRERIGVVASKYGDKIWLGLGTSYVSYYGHSSEYIHGSLFGALDFIAKRDKTEFYESMTTTFWTCLIEIGMSILALLDVLEVETGIKEFGETSRRLAGNLLGAAELAGGQNSGDAN